MEELKTIIRIMAAILGMIFTVVFLITEKTKWGIWVLIMGQIAYQTP